MEWPKRETCLGPRIQPRGLVRGVESNYEENISFVCQLSRGICLATRGIVNKLITMSPMKLDQIGGFFLLPCRHTLNAEPDYRFQLRLKVAYFT